MESSQDPRKRLTQEKFFTLRPKPLEQWLWQQGVPQSAERVFWLHWEQGMRRRDWCSEISLRQVARECRIDTSSVSRAYQLLRALGLIRREDPGRDPANPYRQITPVTEVRIPRALVLELERHPSRRAATAVVTSAVDHAAPASVTHPEPASAAAEPASAPRSWTRAEIASLWSKVSDGERGRHFQASRDYLDSMTFDADTKLSIEERQFLLKGLEQIVDARNRASADAKSVRPGAQPSTSAIQNRRLTAFEVARARRAITVIVPTSQQASDLLRQVVWAVEEGALRRFQALKALNIALKKVREGQWTRPHRMPPNWRRTVADLELCGAA